MADPTRRATVVRLAAGDATVNELAEPFDMSLPGISKHLEVLERSGLITRSRQAQFRPCHLERAALDAAMDEVRQRFGNGSVMRGVLLGRDPGLEMPMLPD